MTRNGPFVVLFVLNGLLSTWGFIGGVDWALLPAAIAYVFGVWATTLHLQETA